MPSASPRAARQQQRQGRPNAAIAARDIDTLCATDAEAARLAQTAAQRLG